MSSTVLVTGGAGFIGCALASRLVSMGERVIALDILHPQIHAQRGRPLRLPEQVELIPVDVTAQAGWDAVLKLVRPDKIVHLAAETGTGQSLTEASRHGRVNVVGTTEMLDALLRAQVVPERIVLASSRAVYGEGEWIAGNGEVVLPGPRTNKDLSAAKWDPLGPDGAPAVPRASRADRTVPRPTSVYGATKLAQEHILGAWVAATGTALPIVRLQNVYGPGQALGNSYTGIVTLFARLAMEARQIEVYEDGRIVRDFVFVDDVVDALASALQVPLAQPRIFDIGSGVATTIHDLATQLSTRLKAPAPIISGRFRDGDVRAASADIGSARADLAFHPKWSLQDGLGAMLDWIAAEGRMTA